jgi:CRP-like cAMP-binding protein
MTPPHPFIDFLRIHIELSDEHSALILSYLSVQKYSPLEFFIENGQKSDRMAFVISGVFRFYSIDDEGSEVTSSFMKENHLVSDRISFFDGSTGSGTIQAETDCEVVSFSKKSWDLFCNSIPSWEIGFQKIISEALRIHTDFQRSIINLDAKDSYLLFMKSKPTILQRVPLSHVATYIGITPSSLSRIRKSLNSK